MAQVACGGTAPRHTRARGSCRPRCRSARVARRRARRRRRRRALGRVCSVARGRHGRARAAAAAHGAGNRGRRCSRDGAGASSTTRGTARPVAALAAERGSERPALREAIELACRNGGAEALPVVRAWSETNAQNIAARAALALALSRANSTDTLRPLAAELITADAAHADRFEDRWRIVQATRALPAEAGVDTWLAGLAKDDERWMLRAAAIQALSERNAAQRNDVAIAALTDPYPRVRAQAAGVLTATPEARDPLTLHATRDTWPLVRAAALDALAAQPGNEAVLRKAIDDHKSPGARGRRARCDQGACSRRVATGRRTNEARRRVAGSDRRVDPLRRRLVRSRSGAAAQSCAPARNQT